PFSPAGARPAERLAAYAARLPAVELNNTFRRRPTPSAIRGWVSATPPEFRFAVKAQRGSAVRALWGAPEASGRRVSGEGPPVRGGAGAVGRAGGERARADRAARRVRRAAGVRPVPRPGRGS